MYESHDLNRFVFVFIRRRCTSRHNCLQTRTDGEKLSRTIKRRLRATRQSLFSYLFRALPAFQSSPAFIVSYAQALHQTLPHLSDPSHGENVRDMALQLLSKINGRLESKQPRLWGKAFQLKCSILKDESTWLLIHTIPV